MSEQDQLFPVPSSPPSRLAAARARLEIVAEKYRDSDDGTGMIETAIYNEFLDAQEELRAAELEVFNRER